MQKNRRRPLRDCGGAVRMRVFAHAVPSAHVDHVPTPPMVQSAVLCRRAPRRKARASSPHREASARRRDRCQSRAGAAYFLLHERCLACRRRAGGIFLDEGAQASRARGLCPAHPGSSRCLRQRVGRLGILRPELDYFLLAGWRLVVAHRVVRVCLSSTAPRQELAAPKLVMKFWNRDGELIVAELELVSASSYPVFRAALRSLAQLRPEAAMRLLDFLRRLSRST